jgi:hypothetical protein
VHRTLGCPVREEEAESINRRNGTLGCPVREEEEESINRRNRNSCRWHFLRLASLIHGSFDLWLLEVTSDLRCQVAILKVREACNPPRLDCSDSGKILSAGIGKLRKDHPLGIALI